MGTRQSSKYSSAVLEERHIILPCMGLAVNPLVPLSTRMHDSSARPSGRTPVRASTVTPAVTRVAALVMKILLPLITHSSPSSTAVVRELEASEPALGSVSPNPHRVSPVQSLGR